MEWKKISFLSKSFQICFQFYHMWANLRDFCAMQQIAWANVNIKPHRMGGKKLHFVLIISYNRFLSICFCKIFILRVILLKLKCHKLKVIYFYWHHILLLLDCNLFLRYFTWGFCCLMYFYRGWKREHFFRRPDNK
jgi:hypothetical protein